MLIHIAIGDAYGAGFEFAPRAKIDAHNDGAGYVVHEQGIPAGHYADDTQMSIAIAELLLHDAPPDPPACAQAFVRAYQRDPRGGYSRGFGQRLSEVADGAELLRRAARIDELAALVAARTGFQLLSDWRDEVAVDAIETLHAVHTALAATRSMRALLRACVAFGGDTDSVAPIALGLASLSGEFVDDLPASLHAWLENTAYGRDWLGALDARLVARYPLLGVVA